MVTPLTLYQLSQHSLKIPFTSASFFVRIIVINDLFITGENLKLMGRDAEAAAAVNEERLIDRQNCVNVKVREIDGRIGGDVEGEER